MIQCWYSDLSQLKNSEIYVRFWHAQHVTPGQFVDLSAFWHLQSRKHASNTAARVYESTSKHSKIKDAFSLEDLEGFQAGSAKPPLTKEEAESLSQGEIRAMVDGLAERYGWDAMGYEESWKAVEEQKQGEKGSVDHNAQNMILGQGQRKF